MRNYEKKHYVEIAKLLKALNVKTNSSSYLNGNVALIDVDKAFIKLFSEDSSKFNVDIFLKAIGYNQEEINHLLLRARLS